MNDFLSNNRIAIQQLMLKHAVIKAYAFGSAVKGNATMNSDVDFVVKFDNALTFETYYENYISLLHGLEQLLQKPVDLVAEETLQNPYLIQSISNNKFDLI